MAQQDKKKQRGYHEKIIKESIEKFGVYNPFEETEYKQKGRIVIASLDAVEKYNRDIWCINEELFEMKDEPYVKIVGEFWYCGQLQDGKILYPLSEFEEFLETVKPSVKIIENNIMFFNHPLSKRASNKIFNLEIEVQHIGTEFGDPEDNEIYLKISNLDEMKKNNR